MNSNEMQRKIFVSTSIKSKLLDESTRRDTFSYLFTGFTLILTSFFSPSNSPDLKWVPSWGSVDSFVRSLVMSTLFSAAEIRINIQRCTCGTRQRHFRLVFQAQEAESDINRCAQVFPVSQVDYARLYDRTQCPDLLYWSTVLY